MLFLFALAKEKHRLGWGQVVGVCDSGLVGDACLLPIAELWEPWHLKKQNVFHGVFLFGESLER